MNGIIKPAMDSNSPNWCESCRHEHGPLYICESYSEERKARIRKNDELYRKSMNDPKWVEEQIKNGVPKEVLDIFKMLAGE